MGMTMLVFVGHHKERILESIRALELPLEKIVLLIGEEEISGEEKVRKVAGELKEELKRDFKVEVGEINKRDLMKAVVQILKIIGDESATGREVIVNASGSLRILAIAGYIASCVAKCRIFTSIPKYDENFEEIGIEQVIEVPILPIDFPMGEQLRVLSAIDGGLNSLDELVMKLNPGIDRNSRELFNERSRLSHLVSRLEAMGFVKREKSGRNVKITLTELGKILAGVRL